MNNIKKCEDCIFIIKSRIETMWKRDETLQTVSLEFDEYNKKKLINGFKKAKELLNLIQEETGSEVESEVSITSLNQHCPNISNNDLILLIKIKNILEELKNIFYNKYGFELYEISELFKQITNIIMKCCNHNIVDDYIDIDLDNSMRIQYCNICYCTHNK